MEDGPKENEQRPDPLRDAPASAAGAIDAENPGSQISDADEEEILAWLTEPKPPEPLEFDVPVTLTMPSGREAKVTWILVQKPGKELDRIEQRNLRSGPGGEPDDLRMNAEIVAECTAGIELKSGRRIAVESDEFRFGGRYSDPADAIEARFRYQPGILAGLAGRVRMITGWSPDRIGEAQARVVKLAGNSSNGSR